MGNEIKRDTLVKNEHGQIKVNLTYIKIKWIAVFYFFGKSLYRSFGPPIKVY